MTSLGIDVGGANLKVADSHGNFKLLYFPIWKKLDKLEYQLRMIRDEFDADTPTYPTFSILENIAA